MLSSQYIEGMKLYRERCRTDLFFLCTELLGYTDLTARVHRPFVRPLDYLMSYASGTDVVMPNGECIYTPDEETLSIALPHDALRRNMLMAFRGSLKTTINTIAHSIQLNLNFPHIAILIFHNTEDVAKVILKEIVDQFASEKMQTYFPDFAIRSESERRRCMSDSSKGFTSPAREIVESRLPLKKEPTITALGLGTSTAGRHVSVIKMTDVVEEVNSQTLPMREKVFKQVNMAINLLEDPRCLVFVEGTPYQPGDAYDRIIQNEYFNKAPLDRSWHFTLVPALEIETGKDQFGRQLPRTYSIDESTKPWKKAEADSIISTYRSGDETYELWQRQGEHISMWPTWRGGQPKFTLEELKKIEAADIYQYACQQLLRPAAEGKGPLAPGVCFHTFPEEEFYKLKFNMCLMAVDTAETENPKTSNDTAISVCKVTETMLRVVIDGFCGMIEAEEIVRLVFEFYEKHRPDIIFVEETSFTRGLKPTFRTHEQKKGYQLPIDWLARKNTVGKPARIRAALRTVMPTGRFKFLDTCPAEYIQRTRTEMSGFPRDHRNDVLDTLADLVAGDTELGDYSNPKLEALRVAHEAQERLKVDWQTWVDHMTGRYVEHEDKAPLAQGSRGLRAGM